MPQFFFLVLKPYSTSDTYFSLTQKCHLIVSPHYLVPHEQPAMNPTPSSLLSWPWPCLHCSPSLPNPQNLSKIPIHNPSSLSSLTLFQEGFYSSPPPFHWTLFSSCPFNSDSQNPPLRHLNHHHHHRHHLILFFQALPTPSLGSSSMAMALPFGYRLNLRTSRSLRYGSYILWSILFVSCYKDSTFTLL